MKKLVSGILLVALMGLGGSFVGAEASAGGVAVTTGGNSNPQPSGNGYTASSNAHEAKWGKGNYQPINVTVNGDPVAQGDPPSAM